MTMDIPEVDHNLNRTRLDTRAVVPSRMRLVTLGVVPSRTLVDIPVGDRTRIRARDLQTQVIQGRVPTRAAKGEIT